jgi:hypothetical protein
MMKKRGWILGAAVTAGLAAQAVTLDEWTFYSDQPGKTLPNALNTVGSAVFAPVSGSDDSALLTDGFGNLLSTYSVDGEAGMWTNGAILTASVPTVSSGTYFLRYDFEYDLSDTDSLNDSGAVLGFSLKDSTGSKVAGIALQYDVGASTAPAGLTVDELATDLATIGRVAVIARVNLESQKMDVWYDFSGEPSFDEFSPSATNIAVSLSSVDELEFQATGDFRPIGSTDFAQVNLLRTANDWSGIVGTYDIVTEAAKYSNEWTFERDINGQPLSETINTGTNSPLAQFAAGGTDVYTTNLLTSGNVLICTGEDTPGDGVWTNGAILDASLQSASSGLHYLRYDVAYSLTNSLNDSGTLLGVYFTDGTNESSKAAGLVLGYDTGSLESTKPANRTLTAITNGLALAGTLTAITEVDLDSNTMKVWYSLDGSTPTNYSSPLFTTNITLSTIDNLRFHATGDFRPAGSDDFAAIDNIRHTASWSEITEDLYDSTAAPALSATIVDSLSGGMLIGQTNLLHVVIENSGGPALGVTSTLNYTGDHPNAFTIVSNNSPVNIGGNTTITNTYQVIAGINGSYIFNAQAFSDETNSTIATLNLAVGVEISSQTTTIMEETADGRYYPGEILYITVATENTGGQTVNNITNTLSAGNSQYFTISPTSKVYDTLSKGASTSTVYQVTISSAAPNGPQSFFITDRSAAGSWTNSFSLDIFKQGIPEISTNAITIRVAPGETAIGSVMLSNTGNDSVSYTVSDDGTQSIDSYSVTTQSVRRLSLSSTVPTADWTNTLTVAKDIGFDMPVFGELYQFFSISQNGYIVLTSTNNTTAELWPLKSGTAIDRFAVHCESETNRLVVSWNDGSSVDFQAWLNADGTIQYLYGNNSSITGTIGLKNTTHTQTISHAPGSSGTRDCLILAPNDWVTYSPITDSVPVSGSTPLVFTADASGRTEETNTFTVFVRWGNNTVSPIEVTAVVESANPSLSILSPTPFTFSGPAGEITRAYMTLTNNGNVSIDYTITDLSQKTNGYNISVVDYDWKSTSSLSLQEDQLGSAPIAIGFSFPFFGNSYTSLIVNANGSLAFGDGQSITAFSVGIYKGSKPSAFIRTSVDKTNFTVTWRDDESNIEFQSVLGKDGTIICNYQLMPAGWTNGVVRINTSLSTNLIIEGKTYFSASNYYRTQVSKVALCFSPVSGPKMIHTSPLSGMIPTGQSTNILVTGDARSLNKNGTYDVTNRTTLAFNYADTAISSDVIFIATNSADSAYSDPSGDQMEAMWGGNPLVTSTQNTDGSRTISWAAPDDGLSRTYNVYYTTSLTTPWTWMATVENGTGHVDNEHNEEPVIFYKVTVE